MGAGIVERGYRGLSGRRKVHRNVGREHLCQTLCTSPGVTLLFQNPRSKMGSWIFVESDVCFHLISHFVFQVEYRLFLDKLRSRPALAAGRVRSNV